MGTAITFDFHNTLVRCDEWFNLEVRELPGMVGKRLGLTSDAAIEEIYRTIRAQVIDTGNELDATSGVIETWRRTGVALDAADVTPIIDDLMRNLVDRSTLLDGVLDALTSVDADDVPVGVISSAVHHDFLEWSLEYHEVRHRFDAVVTSASVGYYKSRPEIYTIALERLGVDPENAIHIGDSFRFDHLTSSAIGMRTVWLNPDDSPKPGDSRPPTSEIRSMSELPNVLNALLAEPAFSDAS
jgi:FMN phosphatase YigB (HAD superfamily)